MHVKNSASRYPRVTRIQIVTHGGWRQSGTRQCSASTTTSDWSTLFMPANAPGFANWSKNTQQKFRLGLARWLLRNSIQPAGRGGAPAGFRRNRKIV